MWELEPLISIRHVSNLREITSSCSRRCAAYLTHPTL